jgi:hypothetical protein
VDGIVLTLRTAHGRAAQQAAIDAWLGGSPGDGRTGAAILAEGALHELDVPPQVPLVRLAAGCVCCVGLVPLRVSLTRLVRASRPRRLLVLIATDEHAARVRRLLAGDGLGFDLREEGPP